MSTIPAVIKRHPVLTYFALVFAISWGSALLILGLHIRQGTDEEIGRLMPPLYLGMMAGPSIAGILLTGLVYGRAGLREMLSRLIRWRVAARWCAIALFTTPLLATATLFALSLTSPDFLPRIYTAVDKAFILQFALVVGLMVGVTEEIGWTGFVIPRLRTSYGIVATGLIVGLVIGVRQMLVVYFTSRGASGSLPAVLYLPAVTLTWLPSYRALMVYVYDRTKSLFVAILMHASLIAFWYILTPLTLAGATFAAFFIAFSAAVWVAIAVLLGGRNCAFIIRQVSGGWRAAGSVT